MNKKSLLCLILTVMVCAFSRLYAQDEVLMGSAPTYTSIGEDPIFFYDPGGVPGHPGDNNHPQGYFDVNLRDTMSLRTNVSGSQLYIIFTDFSMGYGDTLFIFDGQDCTAPLIGSYNNVTSPGEITATGRWLTFVFHSDDVNDYAELSAGWIAKAMAVMPDAQICTHSHGMEYMTCNALYYDQGGANGNIGANAGTTYTEFTSPVGSHVKVHFTQFNVGGIMKIYDGKFYDPNKRLIGQFCTSTSNPPAQIISSGSTLTFEYVGGNGDNNKPGWAAEVSCIAEIFQSPEGSACPAVTILRNGQDVSIVEFDCDTPLVILEADIVATGPYTYDYMVESIPYESRIFGFDLGTSLGASVDDDWINLSGTALPFSFSFFGTAYNRVWPGANGLISMTQPASMYCNYNYPAPPASPPYTAVPYIFKNCIYGVYEDIYPGHYLSGGDVRVGVQGSAPCRAFVFNYDRVGLFGTYSNGNDWYNTYQMVIYEGTNIIDVFVKHRKCCASTNNNNHEGIIGLQNSTSSQILIAPGRGMTGWEVLTDADSEGWRFTPITPMDPNASITWYENAVNPDNIKGTNKKFVASPRETTRYIVKYTYTNAGGDYFELLDTVLIKVDIPSVTATNNAGSSTCPGDAVTLTVTAGASASGVLPRTYQWSNGDTTQSPIIYPTESGEYTVLVTFDNGCQNTATTEVRVTEMEKPLITVAEGSSDELCFGESCTLIATHPTSNVFEWNTGETSHTITVTPPVTTVYSVSVTLEGDCHTSDTLEVTVHPLPIPAFTTASTDIFVNEGVGTAYCTSMSDPSNNLRWDFGDVFSAENIVLDDPNPTHDYTHSGYYSITLTAIDTNGCRDSVKTRVSVTVPYFFYIPNSFSPNGDGINERFAPAGEGVDAAEYLMMIYDRNGNILFKTRNPYDYWDGRGRDGKACPAGVYVYYILLKTLNGEDKEYTGSVTLIK